MDENNQAPPGYPPPPDDQQQQPNYQQPAPGFEQYQQPPPPPPGYQQYQQPPPGYQQYQQQPPPFYEGYQGYNRYVGFIEAYVAYWKNYANFNDRTSRAGYWWVVLMNAIISSIISIFTTVASVGLFATAFENPYAASDPLAWMSLTGFGALYIISTIWSLANLVPGLAISVRRLHDVGKSWPWILINLIPVVGTIIYIVIVATEQKHPPENQFGYLYQV